MLLIPWARSLIRRIRQKSLKVLYLDNPNNVKKKNLAKKKRNQPFLSSVPEGIFCIWKYASGTDGFKNIIIFSLECFDIFTLHPILNIFLVERMHLGPTIVKIKVGQVMSTDALGT